MKASSAPHHDRFWTASYFRATILYVVAGMVWIVLTDALVAGFLSDPRHITLAQTIKGWAYVVGTAVILWFLMRHYVIRIENSSRVIEEANRQIVRYNRALKALSGCNRLLSKARNESDLLQAACDLIVSVCGYRLAWVGFAWDDENKTVRPVAHAGFEDGYLATADITWGEGERGGGPTGTAIRTGEPGVMRNIRLDPKYAPWREQAIKRGYASSIALPLKANHVVLGALNVYAGEHDAFDEEEIRLLMEMANHIACGIAGLRARKDLDQTRGALAASEDTLRVLFDAVRDGIVVADIETKRLVIGNQTMARMLGYRPDELRELRVHDIHPEADVPRILAQFQRQSDGETDVIETPMKRKDGSTFHAELNAAPVRLEGRECLLGVFRDATMRKEAERRLKETEEQLCQSQRLEATGLLAGGIAHDFNNMLCVIINYCDLSLQATNKKSELYGNLEQIRRCAESAAALTRQLLAFSRKQLLQPQVVDINQLVAEMREMLGRLIGEDIEFVVVPGGNLDRVKVDPVQMEQVLINLVTNARDAMHGGGTLTIRTANTILGRKPACEPAGVQPGRYVMLAVNDTGVGMDEETRKRTFEPFFTTKEKGKGTGLGLSTVYGIVKQSGGDIRIRSKAGEGTTFEVYLPVTQEAESEKPMPRTREKAESGSGTVLVVEDEKMLLKLVATVLKAAGYRVILAGSAEEAARLCEGHSGTIDLMLTDIVMPGMGIGELVKRLLGLRPDMKILYMSGYADETIAQHGVFREDAPFIQKPFRASELVDKVREVLSG